MDLIFNFLSFFCSSEFFYLSYFFHLNILDPATLLKILAGYNCLEDFIFDQEYFIFL